MMKHIFFSGLIFFCLLNGSLVMADGIGDHPYFKAITGKWIGKGEISVADGTTIKVKEVWEGKVSDDGTFVVSGSRDWGEEKQEFKWVFSQNPSTDLFECQYTFTGLEKAMRFEVSMTDNSAELKAPFGQPGGEIRITNAIKDKSLEGDVLLSNEVGVEVIKGKVIHTRTKE